MHLKLADLALPLVHTFTISRGSETTSRSVLFRLSGDDGEGLGESAPSARYDESTASIHAWFRDRPLPDGDVAALEALLPGMPPGARCGLDIAILDYAGKRRDEPLWRRFGLDPSGTPVTSFTIGIDTPEAMLAKLDEIRDHPIVKVKLGFDGDVDVIEAMRARFTGAIRVDANEGWTPEAAVANLERLARFDVEFCEQPIPAGTPERLRYVRERSRVPIVADEDAVDAGSVAALAGCVDGVNVKLVKCGGITPALEMIRVARAHGMKIMLGCMVESAVLTTAAAHISPLVDWADLDGPFLTARDPFAGITYERGKIVLPQGPGLGVTEREPAAAFAP